MNPQIKMSLFNSQNIDNARSEEGKFSLPGFQPFGHFRISLIGYSDEMPSCSFEQSVESFDTKIVCLVNWRTIPVNKTLLANILNPQPPPLLTVHVNQVTHALCNCFCMSF